MRLIIAIMVSLVLVPALPRVSFAAEVVASRAEVAPPAVPVDEPAQDGTMSLGAQEIVIGTVALGGAFAIGFIAGGGLATGIVAAGVLAISYGVLP